MKTKATTLLAATLSLPSAAMAPAEDTFYSVSVGELSLKEGRLPSWDTTPTRQRFLRLQTLLPYVLLDGPGEAYLALGGQVAGSGLLDYEELGRATVAVRAPHDRDVQGRLFAPGPDLKGLIPYTFTIPALRGDPKGRVAFLVAKEEHYLRLVRRSVPGAAWFRHQADAARRARVEIAGEKPAGLEIREWVGSRDLEDTYAIFTGGRALSENLQIDRLLAPAAAAEETVKTASLPGITVHEIDWRPLVKDLKPEKDPLAALIPADQHGIFFPSFQAMIDLMDEADRQGTPVLEQIEPRAEDARTKERYERQLCLEVNDLAQLLGPHLVKSVAFTGSDPYLRTGSDVAILFEARSAEVLKGYFRARQAAALKACPEAKAVTSDVDGTPCEGVVSHDRAVSSYLAVTGDAVFVANSLHQLRRIAEAANGKSPSLASLDEYTFFRHRYARGEDDETALLIVPDGAIRRWCGPRWRIATSRRTRAAAAMSELQAAHLDELVARTVEPGPLTTSMAVPGAGVFHLTPGGVTSGTYGKLEFLTPIAEIPLDLVTKFEAEVYRVYRDRYQSNWRQYFDPIAVRFTLKPEKIAADLTVMPLIEGSQYRELIDLTRGGEVRADAGDRHAGALMQMALAVNHDSEPVKEAAGFLRSAAPGPELNPLAWLGSSVALYADEDPFWEELTRGESIWEFAFLERKIHRLPVALHVEVRSALGLTAFLAAMRGDIEQTSPGMTTWQVLEHQGQPYVRVAASERARGSEDGWDKVAIHYAATPDVLIVSLNEDVLKRALDRRAGRVDARRAPVKPWLGSHLNLQMDSRILKVVLAGFFGGEGLEDSARRLSWDNLPILNEWKRRYPDRDPLEVHERFWHRRLECPGGGSYVWNERFATMESTAYGHPGEPRAGPDLLAALAGILSGNFGLTFEHQGLRARAVLERKAPAR
jgi:hypothetical protein